MTRTIRPSAKALIIRDGKMAAVRLREGDDEWFIMPGGGQDVEETLEEAVCREVAEELGIRVACHDLLFVVEGVHGEAFHRIDLVFECEYLGEIPNVSLRSDTHQVGIEWLDVSTLNRAPLYPSKLRKPIMQFCAGKAHRIYLGNEEIGDPEENEKECGPF